MLFQQAPRWPWFENQNSVWAKKDQKQFHLFWSHLCYKSNLQFGAKLIKGWFHLLWSHLFCLSLHLLQSGPLFPHLQTRRQIKRRDMIKKSNKGRLFDPFNQHTDVHCNATKRIDLEGGHFQNTKINGSRSRCSMSRVILSDTPTSSLQSYFTKFSLIALKHRIHQQNYTSYT